VNGGARCRLPRWRVSVAEHELPPRWRIEGQVLEVSAADERDARAAGTRAAHIAAGVPGWRPLLRQTYMQTSATPLAA